MQKILYTIVVFALIISCAKDSNIIDSPTLDVLDEKYDNSNLGNYKGVFTTSNSAQRGVINVDILEDIAVATMTMEDGTVHEFVADTEGIVAGQETFLDFSGPMGQFQFYVSGDGSSVELDEVTFDGQLGYFLTKKNTAKAPVTPVPGKYSCTNCDAGQAIAAAGGHSVFTSNSVERTFNFVFSAGQIETQITYGDGTSDPVFIDGNGIMPQDASDSFDGGTETMGGTGFNSISGSSWVFAEVQWTGMHNFSIGGNDRSVVQGTWTFDVGGTTMTGMFYGQTSNPVSSKDDLLPGDIVLVRAYSDNSTDGISDVISFASTVDIPDGITIFWTDNAWLGTALRSGEGTESMMTSGMTKGSIQTMSSGLTIAAGGDQVHIYVEDGSSAPRFISSFTWAAGDADYQLMGADDSNETQLPSGLVNSVTGFFLGTQDNHAVSSMTLSSSKSNFLNHLSNPDNYTSNSSGLSSTAGLTTLTITD